MRGCTLSSAKAVTSLSAFAFDDLTALAGACNLHSRQPVLPQRRINRHPISPFQTTYEKLDHLIGLAMAPPNGFEEDPHRVIAFNDGDRVSRLHDGRVR